MPVLYSFLLLLIVTSIFAIICTEMFGSGDEESYAMFGNFTRSLFTLFQVATGDSWASAIVRKLMADHQGVAGSALIGLFFVIYMLVVGIVLTNIVIAVLLDEFISTVAKEKADKENELKKLEDVGRMAFVAGPLDELLLSLIADFTSMADLNSRLALAARALPSACCLAH